MFCRKSCGACCIAPSINEPFYGMPQGKPAGVACVHLDETMSCLLFGDSRRPSLCAAFAAEPDLCGDNRDQALQRITMLEQQTLPNGGPLSD